MSQSDEKTKSLQHQKIQFSKSEETLEFVIQYNSTDC